MKEEEEEEEEKFSLPPALPPSTKIVFTEKRTLLSYNQPRGILQQLHQQDSSSSSSSSNNNNSSIDANYPLQQQQQPQLVDHANEKRRENIITNTRGVVMKKICGVMDCNKIITVRVDRYTAIKSGKLCKGHTNTRRLFVRGDTVDVISPADVVVVPGSCPAPKDKVCLIARRAVNGKEDMCSRVLQDYVECLSFKGHYTQMFRARRMGTTKMEGTPCYLIKPINGGEIWVESPQIIRDADAVCDQGALPFEDRSAVQPMDLGSSVLMPQLQQQQQHHQLLLPLPLPSPLNSSAKPPQSNITSMLE